MANSQLLRELINEPKKLSKNQEKAVLSDSEYLRIIAGAGAGKTETLTRRITYLLLYKEVDPSSIVAFTFTEKAAQSMKSRIYQRVSQSGREDIVKKLGEMYIGTIHSFCLQILEDHFEYGNYDVLDENQEMAFLLRYGWNLGLNKEDGPYSKNCETFLNSLRVVYNEMLDRKVLKKQAPDFFKKLKKYEEFLDSHHRLTFDRLLYEAASRIEKNPEILDYIKYLIVDEFQDINKCQFQLIESIGKSANVFVVGDPRQSVYQWRGSNERFFLDFSEKFPGAKTVNIKGNWRSSNEIVRISNEFADNFEEVDYEHMHAKRKNPGEVTKLYFKNNDKEAKWITDQIERLVNEGKCNYSDFGVLLRSVNTSAEPFLRKFKARGIPFLVGGKVGLFRRDEAQAVGRLFSWLSDEGFWVENPYNWSSQVKGDDLLKTGLQHWENAVDFSLPSDIREQLEEWKRDVLGGSYNGYKEVYHELLYILGYLNLNPQNQLHAALMANLGRFSSLLGDFEISRRLGGKKIKWKGDTKNLCWYLNSYATKSYEEQPSEDLRGVDAVQITTVHQAKGLEWPVVFVPALVRGRFPSSMAGNKRRWLIPRDLFDAERYEGGEEEEKRLFYVAVTRAQDKSILSYFTKYKNAKSQSDFLDIIDEISVNETERNSYNLEYESTDEVSDEEIQTFSATEIINYMKCPHHYRLLNLWGYVQSQSPLIGYGDILHFCLRYASELIQNYGMSPRSAVATAVDEKFYLPFAGSTQTEKVRRHAKKKLKEFARKREEDMEKIDEVESRLEFPVQNATIAGKVDVIMKDQGSFEVRDYKTSDEVITEKDTAMQVRLYSLGLSNMGKNVEKGSIATLEKADLKPVSVEQDKLNISREKAENVISKIKNKQFEPKPGNFCKQCEYFKICRGRN